MNQLLGSSEQYGLSCSTGDVTLSPRAHMLLNKSCLRLHFSLINQQKCCSAMRDHLWLEQRKEEEQKRKRTMST